MHDLHGGLFLSAGCPAFFMCPNDSMLYPENIVSAFPLAISGFAAGWHNAGPAAARTAVSLRQRPVCAPQ